MKITLLMLIASTLIAFATSFPLPIWMSVGIALVTNYAIGFWLDAMIAVAHAISAITPSLHEQKSPLPPHWLRAAMTVMTYGESILSGVAREYVCRVT